MLVLTRKKNQSIIIADNIEIVVVDIKGDQIKIGVNAPKNISVHRKEVYEEIQMENKLAATNKIHINKVRELESLLKGKLPQD
ncbi:MAG: carbon storage regulator CsrA [Candidatus Muirbacterium halophilum]|nr:carbon storage regulator CsrA [Candidatus Muirbacterium halophilum]MCK9474762.1 carbon storage regulator CsrA [Candidatus Muirbacterium halophilum]